MSETSRNILWRRWLYGVLVALCLAALIAGSRENESEVIRIAFLGSVEDEDMLAAEAFRQQVEARTNGRVKVEIFPAGQFCSTARECLEALRAGTLEVTMTTAGGVGSLFGPAQILDLPYAFPDDAVAECVIAGPLAGELRAAVRAAGTGLYLGTITNTGGWRSIATTRTPIYTPDDLAGVKLRTVTAPLQQQLTRTLGASPTPIAWSELYTALATGVVEGTKNSVQDIMSQRLGEHIRYLTLDGHAYMGALWWYSEPLWEAASPARRILLTEAFEALKVEALGAVKRREAAAYRAFEAAGGSVIRLTPAQKAAFARRAMPVRDWFAERYDSRWLKALDRAKAACGAKD